MKFTKKKGDESTIRKVYNDDKSTCYGLVGKISDLLKEGVLEWSDYPGHLWLFLGINSSTTDHYEMKPWRNWRRRCAYDLLGNPRLGSQGH